MQAHITCASLWMHFCGRNSMMEHNLSRSILWMLWLLQNIEHTFKLIMYVSTGQNVKIAHMLVAYWYFAP